MSKPKLTTLLVALQSVSEILTLLDSLGISPVILASVLQAQGPKSKAIQLILSKRILRPEDFSELFRD